MCMRFLTGFSLTAGLENYSSRGTRLQPVKSVSSSGSQSFSGFNAAPPCDYITSTSYTVVLTPPAFQFSCTLVSDEFPSSSRSTAAIRTSAAYPWLRSISWLINLIGSASFRFANKSAITVTPGLQRWLHSEIPNRAVSVIANATNADLFRPDAPCVLKLPESYAVFAGSLAAWQGIETILEAVELPSWPRSTSLVIAGEGFLQPVVEKAASNNPNIIYLGTLPYSETPGLIARSTVALIPKNDILDSSVTGLSP